MPRNTTFHSLSFSPDFYTYPNTTSANFIQHSPIDDLHLNFVFPNFRLMYVNYQENIGALFQKWHPGLAKAAQRWANRCLGLVHDNATGLYLDGFGQSGQNIFITTRRTLWWVYTQAYLCINKYFTILKIFPMRYFA